MRSCPWDLEIGIASLSYENEISTENSWTCTVFAQWSFNKWIINGIYLYFPGKSENNFNRLGTILTWDSKGLFTRVSMLASACAFASNCNMFMRMLRQTQRIHSLHLTQCPHWHNVIILMQAHTQTQTLTLVWMDLN